MIKNLGVTVSKALVPFISNLGKSETEPPEKVDRLSKKKKETKEPIKKVNEYKYK